MKINQFTQTVMTPQKEIPQQHSSFQEYMNAQSGGDLYWTHQQHLQNSELQFIHQKTLKSSSNIHGSTDTYHDMTEDPIYKSCSMSLNTSSPESLNQHESNSSHILSYMKIDNISASNSIMNSNPYCPQENFKTQIKEVIYSYFMLKKRDINRENDLPKKYHLYIDDKSAEFFLNTSGMDQKQTIELTNLIKIWLNQKGIHHIKFFINGVKTW